MIASRPLTKAQANILAALRSLPARYRYSVGGTIKMQYLEVYDGRTLNSLCGRGLLTFNERGAVVPPTDPTSTHPGEAR